MSDDTETAARSSSTEMRLRVHRRNLVEQGFHLGLRFTPLAGKAPRLPGWQKAEIADEIQSKTWATMGNVGVRCGAASGGLVVIDDDTGDNSGLAALNLLDVETLQVQTGKGRHVYLRAPAGITIRNSVGRLARGVDVRAEGGQVVYAGSVHPTTGKVYEFVEGFGPAEVREIAEVPPELLDRLLAFEEKSLDFARKGSIDANEALEVWEGLAPMTREKLTESIVERISNQAHALSLRDDGTGRNSFACGLGMDIRKASNAAAIGPEEEEELAETVAKSYTESLVRSGMDQGEAESKAVDAVNNGLTYAGSVALDVTELVSKMRDDESFVRSFFDLAIPGRADSRGLLTRANLNDPAVRDLVAASIPLDSFGPDLREYIEALAVAQQVSVELAACSVIAAYSLAVLGRVEVQATRSWRSMVNPWLVSLANTGERKSTAEGVVSKRIIDLIEEAGNRYEESILSDKAELAALRKMRKDITNTTASQSKDDVGNYDAQSREVRPQLEKIASRETAIVEGLRKDPRVVVEDTSMEALLDVCHDTGGRAMLTSTEGNIFAVISGAKFGKGSGVPNLDLFLKGKSGREHFVEVKRANRQAEDGKTRRAVRNVSIGFNFCVQPTAFDRVLSDPERRAELERLGIFGRMLLVRCRSMAGRREVDPDPIPAEIQRRHEDRIERIFRHVFMRPMRLELALSADARAWFLDNVARHYERQMASGGLLSGSRDIGSRLAAHVIDYAGLFHVIEHGATGPSEIDVDTVERAAALVAFFLAGTLKLLDRKRVLVGGGSVADWAERHIESKRGASLLTKEAHTSYLEWFGRIEDPETERVDNLATFSKALGTALTSKAKRLTNKTRDGYFAGFSLKTTN